MHLLYANVVNEEKGKQTLRSLLPSQTFQQSNRNVYKQVTINSCLTKFLESF